ncbi:MAG: hypothetical protein KKB38_20090 [Gammaproteobacteria bacterium]|nr:hypothetical protein [Gammaproteobacteria bacterium]
MTKQRNERLRSLDRRFWINLGKKAKNENNDIEQSDKNRGKKKRRKLVWEGW